jgi:hypothetical protein
LTLIEEHADECGASRTWAGVVDGATSQRFADAWHLPDEFHEPAAANLAEDGHIARVRRTFDGMNWEVDGESPIVYVSVEIGVIKRPLATGPKPSARSWLMASEARKARYCGGLSVEAGWPVLV